MSSSVSAVIHPRLRARRNAVRQAAGRRRVRRYVGATATVLVLALCAVLVQSPLLDVDEVRVEATGRTTVQEVVSASGIDGGEAMATLDLAEVSARIEALPWVDTAALARRWPDTLRVEITERRPVAVLAGQAGAWLVDREGRVLEEVDPAAPSASAPDRPRTGAEGPDESPDRSAVELLTIERAGTSATELEPGKYVEDLQTALLVALRAPLDLPGMLTGVEVGRDATVRAELEGGGVALIGDGSELADKLLALRTVLEQVDRECLALVDLRVPAHPSLRRAPRCD